MADVSEHLLGQHVFFDGVGLLLLGEWIDTVDDHLERLVDLGDVSLFVDFRWLQDRILWRGQMQVDISRNVADNLDLVALFDHLTNRGKQVIELALVLETNLRAVLFVDQLDDSLQASFWVKAGTDHAVFHNLYASAIIHLWSELVSILTLVGLLAFSRLNW